MKILIEAVGSFTSGYLIDAIQSSGHHCVASDITADSAGAKLADSFIQFPPANNPELWQEITALLVQHKIDVVIPTFDEMLNGWAQRKDFFSTLNITVIISAANTIDIFNDKWTSYHAFIAAKVPVPQASLKLIYPVLKPRVGRGGQGIEMLTEQQRLNKQMPENHMSQQKATGDEYTIDCLFDRFGQLIYAIPRKRLLVKEGKSTAGIVDSRADIVKCIEQISQQYSFQGAINFQCFADNDRLAFIEVNARFGGGSALGMAATENWLPLMIDSFVNKQAITASVSVQHGLKMYRQYRDVFCHD